MTDLPDRALDRHDLLPHLFPNPDDYLLLAGLAGAAALAGGLAIVLVANTALAQGPLPRRPGAWQGMGGWSSGGGMMGGMMGGFGPGGAMGPSMIGGWGSGIGSTQAITGTPPLGFNGCPMYGGWDLPGGGTPISMDQAVEAAQRYLAAYGNPDLALTEVMEFTNHFYAEVVEKSTGVHAFELLINRYSGAVYPEPGPNRMWNTKYGHMGGMMGGWWSRPSGKMAVTPEQARMNAQKWLDGNLPGRTAADEVDAFYGYYTIHVLQDDQVVGMLSVNGYTGQVWYHTWHGDFVGMRELEG